MSRSGIWFLLAFLWMVDAVLSVARHKQGQAILVLCFACAFLLAGVLVRVLEKRRAPR